MAKTNKEKDPMGANTIIKGLSMELETVPPTKNSTKAQKPQIPLKLLEQGDPYISIPVESVKSKGESR